MIITAYVPIYLSPASPSPGTINLLLSKPLSTDVVKILSFGYFFSIVLMPSGAHNKETSIKFYIFTPDFTIRFTASRDELPVANIGSNTIKSCFLILGNLKRYSTGL